MSQPMLENQHELSIEDEENKSQSFSTASPSGSRSLSKLQGESGSDALEKIEEKIVSKKEQQTVANTRIFVLVVFICCATAVAASVYYFTADSDRSQFEIEYNGFVSDIMSLTQWEIQNNFALMMQLAASVTNAATLSGASFPYVVDPNFEVIGGYADGMSGIISVGFSPFVKSEQAAEWEQFSVANQWWVERGAYLRKVHPQHKDPLDGSFQDHEERRWLAATNTEVMPIPEFIFRLNEDGWPVVLDVQPNQTMAPMWEIAPTPGDDPSLVNYNLLSDPMVANLFKGMTQLNSTVLSEATEIDFLFNHIFDASEKQYKVFPHSFLMEPVFDSFEPDASMVGFLLGVAAWENLLNNILPEGYDGIHCVVKDSCGNEFTYELRGSQPIFLGNTDAHDRTFDKYQRSGVLEKYEITPDELCVHELFVYPTQEFRESYNTVKPLAYTLVVVLSFIFTGAMFVIYDILIARRHQRTMLNAVRTNALVASLFPANVRDRILENAQMKSMAQSSKTSSNLRGSLKGYLNSDGYSSRTESTDADGDLIYDHENVIADLFPHTTVMFADIAGFTAWSSTREPAQVFVLLETVYRAFDRIAKMRRVYKVETVGDCYVAVCGLPDPCKEHAVIITRFARDCVVKMSKLTKKLESVLGPDTADLAIRVGLHSGPVTAGVLRGENARFQLFGDTMNTASRIESTGSPNRIHVSQATAGLLARAGKADWAVERKDKVTAKGKGELTTYWVNVISNKSGSVSSGSDHSSALHDQSPVVDSDDCGRTWAKHAVNPNVSRSDKTKRLVTWNTEILAKLLRSVVARRMTTKPPVETKSALLLLEEDHAKQPGLVLDEVAETIFLPQFRASKNDNTGNVQLSEAVIDQLHDLVSKIANMYHDNPFHSFEHASHVTMSVSKLLTRIVAPTEQDLKDEEADDFMLHDHTYGITSDPLTQFACVLAALLHDVDHAGVPNYQLVKENWDIATRYENKSVAEQNSVDLGWKLLMRREYTELRHLIYVNDDEFQRFRQLIINCVMSTDIMDKELIALRNNRWAKAFAETAKTHSFSKIEDINRKATVVIEHLLQASDVSHTMQHWHIFRKWNERLFREMYNAFRSGRAAKDPSEFWYQGELGFFDFYVIPLAKKLKECGVFGVSSDECLSYAQANRIEWEARGKKIVETMAADVKAEHDSARNRTATSSSSDRGSVATTSVTTASIITRTTPTEQNSKNEES